MSKWHLGQLVRVRRSGAETRGGIVVRLTPTLVVLRDGSRWRRDNGRAHGMGPTADRIEPWGEAHRARRLDALNVSGVHWTQ